MELSLDLAKMTPDMQNTPQVMFDLNVPRSVTFVSLALLVIYL